MLGLPVYLRNDVHLLGLVEKRKYLPEKWDDLIFVAIRTGIGSIVYHHGKAMRGQKGNAGFLGHTIMNPHGSRCCCGNYGCLETYAGQTAIVNAYNACTHGREDFEAVLQRAQTGENTARRILEDAGFYFGVALANMIKTFEIPNVVVNCKAELAQGPFMEAAQRAMTRYSTASLSLDTAMVTSQLQEEEYALGGCYLVFEHMISKPKLALTLN